MVTLAEAFAAASQAVPEPQAPPTNQAPPQNMQSPPAGRSSRGSNDNAPQTPAALANQAHANNPLSGVDAGGEQGISAPVSFGMWDQFNYTTRVTSTKIMIRVIVHNAVELQDIEYEWVDKRTLRIRIAWPEWFQMAEQMAAFTVDEDGNIVFPPEHALTMDMSRRNQMLVEEDSGRVWDQGCLRFEQDMSSENPFFELLTVQHPSKNTTVNVLQIFCEVEPLRSPLRQNVNRARTVNFGSGARAGAINARTASQRDGDDNGMDHEDPNTGSNSRQRFG
mmetsp:Transcript_3137/g.5671  ORF Transcript_3137/g.5671 Transcript_3137/m.5671 type:complete len:279 (+) Transcript_3137:145-981(+)